MKKTTNFNEPLQKEMKSKTFKKEYHKEIKRLSNTTRMEITNANIKDVKWLDMHMIKKGIKSRGEWLSLVVEALKSKDVSLSPRRYE